MLTALPAGADVIVTSAVGMDVNTSRADLLPEMLAAVLRWPPRRRARVRSGACAPPCRPRPSRPGRAHASRPRCARLTARLELRGIEWASTRAFAHPADNQGYVRLNLRAGSATASWPPAEADALIDEIAAGLVSFSDPDGAAAVDPRSCAWPSATPAYRPSACPTSRVPSQRPATSLHGGAPLAAIRRGAPPRAAARDARATTRPAMPGPWSRRERV